MEYSKETIEEIAENVFRTQLLNLVSIFDSSEFVCVRREDVVEELQSQKKREERFEKIGQIPIVGKAIYKAMPKNNSTTSDNCEFMLSVMDKLGVNYLDANIVNSIREKPVVFYEKYYREERINALNEKFQNNEDVAEQ